jgi:uncharacterized membrane protein YidH (DUF202 family)
VHGVIVLVPLAALGAILIAVRSDWSRRYGWLVVITAFVAAGSAFVAKESGEQLASRVSLPVEHADIARFMPAFAGLLFLAVTALWWYDRGGDDRGSRTRTILAVLTVVAAVLALFWVVRAGHSGATAVWGKTIEGTTPGSFPGG